MKNAILLAGLAHFGILIASATVPFAATPSELKAALESVGTGAVSVHRAGPNFELGYVWTVSFLEKEGDCRTLAWCVLTHTPPTHAPPTLDNPLTRHTPHTRSEYTKQHETKG